MHTDGWRPLLVLVSGAPGSGKTTLAKKLAAALGLPHLNRDEIWSGLRFTIRRGAPESIRPRGIVAEYGAIEHLLAIGVSLVADGTMYRDEFEPHVRRLCDLGEVVNVHCRSTQAADRYRAREQARKQPDTEFDRKMERLPEIWPLVVDPLDLSCRLIEVSNESGYDPTVEEIVGLLSP